jgi:hypothetical protein
MKKQAILRRIAGVVIQLDEILALDSKDFSQEDKDRDINKLVNKLYGYLTKFKGADYD